MTLQIVEWRLSHLLSSLTIITYDHNVFIVQAAVKGMIYNTDVSKSGSSCGKNFTREALLKGEG